jgi:archaellum component FlaF (FlaF/FlaG flagellin family)
MKFVDTDNDPTTFNLKATLELSNTGENSSNQNCSTVLLQHYIGPENQMMRISSPQQKKETGTKSVNAKFNGKVTIKISKTLIILKAIKCICRRWSICYLLTGNGNTYKFTFYNNLNITLSVNGGSVNIPYTLTTSGDDVTATLNSSYIIRDGDAYLKIKQLIRKIMDI